MAAVAINPINEMIVPRIVCVGFIVNHLDPLLFEMQIICESNLHRSPSNFENYNRTAHFYFKNCAAAATLTETSE
jgi:hypothetical protein